MKPMKKSSENEFKLPISMAHYAPEQPHVPGTAYTVEKLAFLLLFWVKAMCLLHPTSNFTIAVITKYSQERWRNLEVLPEAVHIRELRISVLCSNLQAGGSACR